LKQGDNVSFSAVVKCLLSDYRQSELLRYVIAGLMECETEENEVRDENLGILILDLKTVIDCFDQQ
jgi:hypothetical protein